MAPRGDLCSSPCGIRARFSLTPACSPLPCYSQHLWSSQAAQGRTGLGGDPESAPVWSLSQRWVLNRSVEKQTDGGPKRKSQQKALEKWFPALLHTRFTQGAFTRVMPRLWHPKPVKLEFRGQGQCGGCLKAFGVQSGVRPTRSMVLGE